jgi:hypothetical protein
MFKKAVSIAFLCLASSFAQNSTTDASTPWKSLQFLIGTWEAKAQGGTAGASVLGTYTFRTELSDHILARHSSNLYVYQNGDGAYKAIYFDSEGHAIHYDVTTPAENSAVFLSGSSQSGPQFRLTYELKNSVMYGKFQMRMPGQAEFKSYLEWGGAKK